MTRHDKQPTFWETQAEFVRERGIPANRKKWTRADDLAWGRFYQAREMYWSRHRQWVSSRKYFEERKAQLYFQLLDAVAFTQNLPWIDQCVRIYIQKDAKIRVPTDEPVLTEVVAEVHARWDAQDEDADTRTVFDHLVAGFDATPGPEL